MSTIYFYKLLLKTAISCMACDGYIDHRETQILKEIVRAEQAFFGIEIQQDIDSITQSFNENFNGFMRVFFLELKDATLSEAEQLKILEIAYKVIQADEEIDYREIKFFKSIRKMLPLSDADILAKYPDWEEYLKPDIIYKSFAEQIESLLFKDIDLPKLERMEIRGQEEVEE